MSGSANSTIPHVDETTANQTSAGLVETSKGKGKAVEPMADVEMADDDDSEDEEEEAAEGDDDADEEEEDNLEEIDLDNIVEGGRRTRGRVIDFAKAAEESKDLDEEDEDDDDDFEEPATADEMEH